MKLRCLKSLCNELLHKPENLLFALVTRAIEPDKAIALNDAHVVREILLLYICEKHLDRRAQHVWLNRNRRVEHECESRRLVSRIRTFMLYRSLDCLRAHRDFSVVNFRARYCEHQSRRVAEVFDEVDWTSALR
jgi:hypothetical protein